MGCYHESAMADIIVARDLVKRYGELTAVDGISFTVEPGECFGFLGPNGAGKTTTIRMITCVSPVTDGSLTVDGMHVQTHARQIKSVLGVVPQDDNLDPELTVRQNMRAYARYFGLSRKVTDARIDEALELMALAERQRDRIDALSGGLKRRLTIARGLLNTPRILVLDEPTTGLDPAARHLVWQRLRLLRTQGVTMLLTTHYMEEAAQLCDRVLVIDHGRIIAQGTPQDLVHEHAGRDVIEVHVTPGERPGVMLQLAQLQEATIEEVEDIVYVYLHGDDGIDPAALEVDAEKLVHRRANLEDVFLRLTGRGLEE